MDDLACLLDISAAQDAPLPDARVPNSDLVIASAPNGTNRLPGLASTATSDNPAPLNGASCSAASVTVRATGA
jgi:hypothetical protein